MSNDNMTLGLGWKHFKNNEYNPTVGDLLIRLKDALEEQDKLLLEVAQALELIDDRQTEIGDKFTVMKEYITAYPKEAMLGDILVVSSMSKDGTAFFKNISREDTVSDFFWGIDYLERITD